MVYTKYVFKCFRQNLARFLSIIAIIALGIGFLVGFSTSSGDIRNSMNKEYVETNVMDLNLKSTLGFSDDSILQLKEDGSIVEGVYQFEPNTSYLNNKRLKSRMISFPLKEAKINKLSLIEGNFPENKNECVVLNDIETYSKANIGDVIEIEDSKEKVKESYKVTGIVSSPMFYAKDKEFNLLGTNKLDLIFYVDSNYSEVKAYTDIFIKYDSLNKANRFEQAYFDKVNNYEKKLQEKEAKILSDREVEIKDEITVEAYKIAREEIRKLFLNQGLTEEQIDAKVEQMLPLIEQTIIDEVNKEYDKRFGSIDPEIYYLNLKTNQSYTSLKENTLKIDKISIIFPIFFYFIAFLVSLTTMTRLVDEERTSIGLLKSLGYSKGQIMGKYLAYSIFCVLLGSILGNLCGVYLLPYVIFNTFKSVYSLPSPVYNVNSIINWISIAVMVVTIISVSLFVVNKSLKEKPAALLLPRPPKAGKRLLVENTYVWRKTPFKYKNTFRNIFRYKKNLFMMMVGVGGCVALLFAAFSIRDTFSNLSNAQYNDIVLYDLKVNVDPTEEINMSEIDEVKEYKSVYEKEIFFDDKDYDIKRIVTTDSLDNYFGFKDGKHPMEFNENDVLIDIQLAKKFDLKVGDSLKFADIDKDYIISGIMMNHVDNYIFIYDKDFDISKNNTYLINVNDNVNVEEFANKLSDLNVNGIEISSQLKDTYNNMLNSIVMILIVAIICSGGLACIVIYNLTNINVNERVKEIATLKVLGYQNIEVYGYIYREIFILSLFGILFGFVLGPILYKFIVINLQSPGLYFSSYINPLFFLYSFLITIGFVLLVEVMFMPKIKHIQMAESLKSVD